MNSSPLNTSSKKYRDIYVSVNGVTLTGIIQSTKQIIGVVTFAHGASSSRFNPVNRQIADHLTEAGIACVLIDLLTPGERALMKQRDVHSSLDLITSRLIRIIRWVKEDETLNTMPQGLFGTNFSAVVAMIAAIECADVISALVLSNTRPEFIKDYLPRINAPTLLIAGDKDRAQLESNEEIEQTLGTLHKLEIISRVTPDIHNPKILEQITEYAQQWFIQQFQVNEH